MSSHSSVRICYAERFGQLLHHSLIFSIVISSSSSILEPAINRRSAVGRFGFHAAAIGRFLRLLDESPMSYGRLVRIQGRFQALGFPPSRCLAVTAELQGPDACFSVGR